MAFNLKYNCKNLIRIFLQFKYNWIQMPLFNQKVTVNDPYIDQITMKGC